MNHGDNAQEIGCDVLCKLADYAVRLIEITRAGKKDPLKDLVHL